MYCYYHLHYYCLYYCYLYYYYLFYYFYHPFYFYLFILLLLSLLLLLLLFLLLLLLFILLLRPEDFAVRSRLCLTNLTLECFEVVWNSSPKYLLKPTSKNALLPNFVYNFLTKQCLTFKLSNFQFQPISHITSLPK